ncbi:mandelate racemase/muconate lactonizing enzyme family protein [Novispirillum itersonii]|uniref:D-galactarolactone cycloisomerase n=1 Tax=Novispirillum itersonii TaxID=189 RepID=A0A7W9ZHI0_NOVIT|nr:mandelate racemase/muconate lactonizing enzyme family protein [Novispirillum itersonii]MBB6211340.1 D-galactarolactone cycloisomerase [Novispirillum itersonii]
MRITAVHTHLLYHRLDQPFQSSFSQFDARFHCLVEIVTDSGLTGWGECLGPATANAAMVQAMAPLLIGGSPLEIERHWLTLYNQFRDQGQRGVTMTALSGLDIALWDLTGKHFNAPVHVLMGGAHRTRIPVYATGGFRPVGRNRIEATVAEMTAAVQAGFRACKIKIGFGIADDLATIAAVREAIGPEVTLAIDANHGYDAIDAIALGRRAERYDLAWFEEPVVPEALEAYARIRRSQPIPVAGGETWHSRWGFAQALQAGAVDILQPDVCGLGGLSEFRRVLTLADVHPVRVVPHVWGTAVAIAAALHAHAILPPAPPAHEARSPHLEFDRTPNPFRQAIVATPLEPVDGILTVPDGPGLGIEINREALAAYAPETF